MEVGEYIGIVQAMESLGFDHVRERNLLWTSLVKITLLKTQSQYQV